MNMVEMARVAGVLGLAIKELIPIVAERENEADASALRDASQSQEDGPRPGPIRWKSERVKAACGRRGGSSRGAASLSCLPASVYGQREFPGGEAQVELCGHQHEAGRWALVRLRRKANVSPALGLGRFLDRRWTAPECHAVPLRIWRHVRNTCACLGS